MGLFARVLTRKSDPTAEIEKQFAIADCEPDDCDSCSAKYPSSVKIEMDMALWNNTSVWDLHIITATGKTDWSHNASDEKHSLLEALNKGDLGKIERQLDSAGGLGGGKLKLSASSMALPHEYYETDNLAVAKSSMLLLPYFLEIHSTTPQSAFVDLSEVVKLHLQDAQKRASLFATTRNLASGATVVPSHNLGYILLCSHKTRDKRCGITAPIMRKQFELVLREHDLYRDVSDDRPGGVNVHFVNHVGGHKFSANVIIYLKTGEVIWMARVLPEHARRIVEVTMLQGKVFPHMLRQAFKTEGVAW